MNGFIKIQKKIKGWEWYKDSIVKAVFLELLISANHKDASWQGVELKRGQIITGRKKLAYELGHTEQEIRTALSKLKKTGSVTIKSTKKYSVVTICKYDDYNVSKNPSNQQVTNRLTNGATNTPTNRATNRATTDEEDKKKRIKEDKKDASQNFDLIQAEINKTITSAYNNKKLFTKLEKIEGTNQEIIEKFCLYWINKMNRGMPGTKRGLLNSFDNWVEHEQKENAPSSEERANLDLILERIDKGFKYHTISPADKKLLIPIAHKVNLQDLDAVIRYYQKRGSTDQNVEHLVKYYEENLKRAKRDGLYRELSIAV